ncbi:DEAD/DEAH box helicase [Bailinhaonella thermotolerans]|uniref:DEAD/DEAH box helicase n=1 Tax=Bailinhaonella thermotolerans TaxID=1070861 RepID=UPI001F5BDCA1|nr:DEAD/DEAH box helicase [Bailinhaonella thermotolerans]
MVFLPGDPPRAGRVAFWREGEPPDGAAEELTLLRPEPATVRALAMPLDEALPVLTRLRAGGGSPSGAFWGAVAVLGLQLVARGRILPGLSPGDFDAWRAGPLEPEDVRRVRELAAAMPPEARAVPVAGSDLLPEAESLVKAFLDAMADVLPRTPAAKAAVGVSPYASMRPHYLPERRSWAEEVTAGLDSGVAVSLRIELPGLAALRDTASWYAYEGGFRVVVQLQSAADPALVADAAEVWGGATGFGADARMETLLTLRRAALAWEPLGPLLSAAVPDAVEVDADEVWELLGEAGRRLAGAGVRVLWPRELTRDLKARAVVTGPDVADPSGFFSADSLLDLSWRFTVGDRRLTPEELDRLAESHLPVVRLHGQWILVDEELARRARERKDLRLSPVDALGAALTGTVEDAGTLVEVEPEGWLATLRDRLAEPENQERVRQPAALAATLRDYQLRGLSWLHRMTSLGLGCCLADDMGLGKTITLIALHLHRQENPGTAGPTLVVCPTSLLGNWEREIERFAPGTPVRRFHGTARDLDDLAGDAFVLTTYGTMRLDAERLGGPVWGMVVADEAQHVKNPFSATARALRTIRARARIALTGTPVENNLSELWAILDWTTPGLLGTLGSFRARYADAVEGDLDREAAERLSRLVRPFLLRRRKSDPGIAPELPPKTETDRAVALTDEQIGLYEAVVRETLAEIRQASGMARRGLVVKLLTSLKQICNHPAQYLKEERPVVPGRSGKLELLDELLGTILAEGGGVLVFTQYVQMARLIEKHLSARGVATQFLHGGTPVRRREEMVRRFQDGEAPVFLLSLKAAGTGLNLTRAGHVIHYDRWWNPAVEEQATDRAYRIGQTQPVQVHRIIAEGTVEDRIAALLAHKRELADAVLGSGEAALTELTDTELAELVALRRGDR